MVREVNLKKNYLNKKKSTFKIKEETQRVKLILFHLNMNMTQIFGTLSRPL